ncbi:hypothetical protein AMTRI_Chr06g173480 [Amborella trichopoda]
MVLCSHRATGRNGSHSATVLCPRAAIERKYLVNGGHAGPQKMRGKEGTRGCIKDGDVKVHRKKKRKGRGHEGLRGLPEKDGGSRADGTQGIIEGVASKKRKKIGGPEVPPRDRREEWS